MVQGATAKVLRRAGKTSVYVILTKVYQGLMWKSIANKTFSQYFCHI